jgi:beta-lactam-binding protein with PASTA domain
MNDESIGGAGGQGPGGPDGPGSGSYGGPEEEPTRIMPEEPTRQMQYIPPVGASIPAGSGVLLGVSAGRPAEARGTIVVPSVVGLPQDDALATLQGEGFAVEIIRNLSQTVSAGIVSHQYPPAGAVATTGSRTAVVVSAGSPAQQARLTVLPDVVGKGEDAAVAELAQVGLRSVIVRDFNAAVPEGVVMAQEPNATTVSPEVVEKRGGKGWLWVLLAIAVVAIAAVAVYFFMAQGGKDVTVPDVTGKTVAEATTALTDIGLELGTVTEKANTDVPAGEIVSQDPQAGATAEEGSRVNVVAAVAPEGVEVPDVTGATVSKAKSDLKAAGLTWRITQVYDDTVAKDVVLAQSPKEGTRVDEGAEIALTVSLGPQPPANTTVPDVEGMTSDEAQQALANAGLTMKSVGDYSDTIPENEVAAQWPAAGSSVAPDTQVLLIVSLGPAPDNVTLVAVPDVSGLSEADATAALEDVGFVVEVFEGTSSSPAGDVFWQYPAAAAEMPEGSNVAIVVSTGPAE